MLFIKKVIGALSVGVVFFLFGLLMIISFGYVLAKVKGLNYNFHDALVQGVHTGLYLGSVITILAFTGTPRRRPPF